ncbi:hypothetical protein [Streptomyces sp. OE57]|uniref:hypothetical protein n=1 Tax=Streptomyces lacaronensis TaxID=3379885 RepID=UPI0039B758AD
MKFEALLHGNFSSLGKAVTDWTEMIDKLESLKWDAEEVLQGRAKKADWAGENATVTREFVTKTAKEFGDAYNQAVTIRNILQDTRNELIGYRDELKRTISAAQKEKNLTVVPSGNGWTIQMNIHPDRAGKGVDLPEHNHADMEDLSGDIKRIVKNATESDTSAAQVLRMLTTQSPYGFSEAYYQDRDHAAKAIADADKIVKLAKKDPGDLTNTQLAQINTALDTYKDDPLFAERFATGLGPKKTLEFWAGVADPYQGSYDPGRGDIAKKLQKSLGTTIGTATLSDSSDMQVWESKMVELGPQRLEIDHAGNPQGFQVMSNLMRFGEYDKTFLTNYGNDLIAYDKKHNSKDLPYWTSNADTADLNFYGKSDRGRDPMNGFLEALGHNPEASTDFFAAPPGENDTVDRDSEVNENLKYLTKERVWRSDAPMGDPDKIVGYNKLGHALESATTGYAYDAPELNGKHPMVPGSTDRRTAETADVMEQVAYIYGGKDGPKLIHEQEGISDSLGRMGAAYIDDINNSVSGISDNAGHDPSEFPAKYQGRAEFGNQGAIDFLSVLGQDEKSHSIVTAAEHVYSLSVLDDSPANSDAHYQRGKDALLTDAEVRGILDHSRVQQAEATYGANSEEANKSIAKSGEWGKYLIGTGVAAGVAMVPVPGSTGAAIALAPVATEAAGEMLNTFLGQKVDEAVDGANSDPTEQTQDARRKFFAAGADDMGKAYDQYFKDSRFADKADDDDLDRDLKDMYYGTGPNEDKYRGRPPYKKD